MSTMTPQQQAQFINNIDWTRLIPAAIALFKQVQDGKLVDDWQRTVEIVKEILESLAIAEQQSAMRIDWAALLPIILKIIIPILIGIGDKDPIEV